MKISRSFSAILLLLFLAGCNTLALGLTEAEIETLNVAGVEVHYHKRASIFWPQKIKEFREEAPKPEGWEERATRRAVRSSDIDVIWVHGYGFPRDLGGPMFWDDKGRLRTKGEI